MKHCFMFLLGIFLSATLYGQNYSSEVVFLQQQGNTLTVRALGISEKKKEAANMALKSAFYTLFYTGVDGVNKGNPMVSTAKPDYDRRFSMKTVIPCLLRTIQLRRDRKNKVSNTAARWK